MPKRQRRGRRSRSEIRALVEEFHQSALSAKAFAEDKAIPASRLRAWIEREGSEPGEPPQALVPLAISYEAHSQVTIELRSGIAVRVAPGFDRGVLLEVLEVLEERC